MLGLQVCTNTSGSRVLEPHPSMLGCTNRLYQPAVPTELSSRQRYWLQLQFNPYNSFLHPTLKSSRDQMSMCMLPMSPCCFTSFFPALPAPAMPFLHCHLTICNLPFQFLLKSSAFLFFRHSFGRATLG